MYKTLFDTSNLSNQEITKRLGITHTQRLQYECATKIDFTKFVMFGRKLDVTDYQISLIVFEGIRKLLNK